MAQLIKEAKRMQKLAGLLNESQLNEVTAEYTKELSDKLKDKFDFKKGYGGDQTVSSISLKGGNNILGYYATDSKSENYPLSKNDPLFGKQIINALSDDNELAKAIKGQQTETQLNEAETIKVGEIYTYDHPKAGPVKVKALGASSWGDEYFTVEAIEDKGEVSKGKQYNAEIKNLSASQSESLDIESIVNEALAKVRKPVNELFGLGTSSPKSGTRVTITYDNVDSKYGGNAVRCMVLQNGSWQLEDTRDYLHPYKEGDVFTHGLVGLGAKEDDKQILRVGDKLKSGGVVKSIVMGNKGVEKIKINYKK